MSSIVMSVLEMLALSAYLVAGLWLLERLGAALIAAISAQLDRLRISGFTKKTLMASANAVTAMALVCIPITAPALLFGWVVIELKP